MIRRLALVATIAGAIAFGAPARAAQFVFTTTLLGAKEVPPNGSTASGTIFVTADTVAESIAVSESWTGLVAPATGAHIHCCAPTTGTAPIVVPFAGFPAATSGTYSATFTAANFTNGGTFASILAGMQAGLAYANIHDATFPGGEIRGQLALVPEASAWTMMVLGFGAVGAGLRRRARPRSRRDPLPA